MKYHCRTGTLQPKSHAEGEVCGAEWHRVNEWGSVIQLLQKKPAPSWFHNNGFICSEQTRYFFRLCTIKLLNSLLFNWPRWVQIATGINRRKIDQVFKHNHNASGPGSSRATSRCKLGEYTRKISLFWVTFRHWTSFLTFVMFSLVKGNIHNKFVIVMSQIQRHDFVTNMWWKHAFHMQMGSTPRGGESHKAHDIVQQIQVQWNTRGHLCFTEVPGTGFCLQSTGAGRHHSSITDTQNHRFSFSSAPRGSQTSMKAGGVCLQAITFLSTQILVCSQSKRKPTLFFFRLGNPTTQRVKTRWKIPEKKIPQVTDRTFCKIFC